MRVNVARTLARSAANGPGERFVVWVQGCPLACAGCWNPDTWPFVRRELRDVEELAAEILATSGIEGVSFTGGEPFAQARALAHLGRRLRSAGLSVFVFTGYELDELVAVDQHALLAVSDVVVTGRYLAAERDIGLRWRGSTNQRIHFVTSRYDETSMADAADLEFHVQANGSVIVTGFPASSMLVGEPEADQQEVTRGSRYGRSRECP